MIDFLGAALFVVVFLAALAAILAAGRYWPPGMD